MEQEITKKEYIKMFSEWHYEKLRQNVLAGILGDPNFKPNYAHTYHFETFSFIDEKLEWKILITESVLRIIEEDPFRELEITRMVLSDEMMPDYALDKYNDYQKIKKERNESILKKFVPSLTP